jgi:DNA-binding NarL/FixJ family response regulator
LTIRVLIADDEPLVRSGIAMLLDAESGIEVVGQVDNGQEAIDAIPRLNPDVVVMDVRMPVMDGVEATRRIVHSAGSPEPPPILILTTYNLDEAIYAALCAGASGFLLKDAAPAELLGAVRALASGEGWLDPGVTRVLIKEFASRVGDPPPLVLNVSGPVLSGAPALGAAPARTGVFQQTGDFWMVSFDDQMHHIRDSIG